MIKFICPDRAGPNRFLGMTYFNDPYTVLSIIRSHWCYIMVTGLFVPLHFRSQERKDHRENFRSRGTFVPWNIRSRGAKSPRTFVAWNFRSCGTFAPQERMFQELSFHGTFAPLELSLLSSECSKNFRSMEPVEPSFHKQLSCPLTFTPVLKVRCCLL